MLMKMSMVFTDMEVGVATTNEVDEVRDKLRVKVTDMDVLKMVFDLGFNSPFIREGWLMFCYTKPRTNKFMG